MTYIFALSWDQLHNDGAADLGKAGSTLSRNPGNSAEPVRNLKH